MSDIADQSQPHIERAVEIALQERKIEVVEATGFCLNCDTPLAEGHRWCDHECQVDWEKRRTLNLHHGD